MSIHDQMTQVVKQIFAHEDQFGKLIGYEGVQFGRGMSVVSLKIDEKHLSPSGAVHGGVLSTLVDFAMGAALFTVLPKGKKCSTIEFKINYFSPVRLHELIYGKAQIKFSGKSHAVIESHIYRENQEKKDIAMAIGTYNIYT